MSSTIYNQATANYEFVGESDSISTSSNINSVTLNDESSGLSIKKVADTSSFSAGSIITYTITISNASTSYLNGIRIVDDLGDGNLAYVVGSANLTAGSLTYAVTPVATNPLTFTLQELNVSGTMTLVYSCQVIFNLESSVSSITNTVQGTGYTSTGTITGSASATILKKNELSVTKTSSVSSVENNESFDYVITLTNPQETDANINMITDQLASNYNLSSISVKVGSSAAVSLLASDYTLSSSNLLVVNSVNGTSVTVPANSSAIVTLSGYFE